MKTATKLTAAEIKAIEERIAELEATPRALVGSDSGTGSPNDEHNIYETITGERYATHSFANANATRCTEDQAKEDTQGYLRYFPNAIAEIRAKARELKALREKLRKASR